MASPTPPVETTVRLSESAWENLQATCREEGITVRSAFEASLTSFLEVWDKPEPTAAETRFLRAALAAVRHLTATDELRPHRVNVRLDAGLVCRLRHLAGRYGVSMSAVGAAVFTPWGSGWGGPEEHAIRAEVWTRAVQAARRQDYNRRNM